jgi:hypothetical protein
MGDPIEEIRRRGDKNLAKRAEQAQAQIEEQHELDAEAKKVSTGTIHGKKVKDISSSEDPPASARKADNVFKGKM